MGKNYQFEDYIKERLDIKYTWMVIDMCPQSLKCLFKRVITMGFEDEPPYAEIIQAFKNEILKDVKIGPNLDPIIAEFEWIGRMEYQQVNNPGLPIYSSNSISELRS
jgi:hypothetical protein